MKNFKSLKMVSMFFLWEKNLQQKLNILKSINSRNYQNTSAPHMRNLHNLIYILFKLLIVWRTSRAPKKKMKWRKELKIEEQYCECLGVFTVLILGDLQWIPTHRSPDDRCICSKMKYRASLASEKRQKKQRQSWTNTRNAGLSTVNCNGLYLT